VSLCQGFLSPEFCIHLKLKYFRPYVNIFLEDVIPLEKFQNTLVEDFYTLRNYEWYCIQVTAVTKKVKHLNAVASLEHT
jgi:hypothetical protein